MRIAVRIIPLLMLTLLTGCSLFTPTVRVKFDPACQWFEDQTFSQETKDWLTRETWPDYVRQDLDKVADNNDLFKEEC